MPLESQEWQIARRIPRDDESPDEDLGGRGSGKICHRRNYGIFALSADYGAQLERHDGLCWRVVMASSGIGAGTALDCDLALEKVQARRWCVRTGGCYRSDTWFMRVWSMF